ncbi:hypothetical protein ABI59_14645 [Acidobacteria bacterium Mor1]|nr:hypothetical protein ABI59_14645 [Acidobacteria bacterium Mor1]
MEFQLNETALYVLSGLNLAVFLMFVADEWLARKRTRVQKAPAARSSAVAPAEALPADLQALIDQVERQAAGSSRGKRQGPAAPTERTA